MHLEKTLATWSKTSYYCHSVEKKIESCSASTCSLSSLALSAFDSDHQTSLFHWLNWQQLSLSDPSMQLTIDPNSKVAGHAILQIFFFCYFSSHNEWNTWSLLLIWWSTQPVDRIWIIWWRFLKHQHGYWFKISPWIMIILMIFKKWSLSTFVTCAQTGVMHGFVLSEARCPLYFSYFFGFFP